MQLPYSDELNIGYLSRLFDNTSNCYKFFWFMAILRKNNGKSTKFSFNDLVDEMIADAWYMVTEYKLHLGPLGVTDNLEEAVKYIHDTYNIIPSEKREKILDLLRSVDDKNIINYKRLLILNVPYRLQVPFYDDISIEKGMWNGSKEQLTKEINTQKRLMYYFLAFNGLQTEILIDEVWTQYLFKHKEILKSWTQLKLIQYLQLRNPSVPGIADKLEPPVSRDLEKVRKYWKMIVDKDPSIEDIYGEITLKDKVLSIDHFVPWQYVAHDELWNLHPTTKSINSSKSNSLPEWDLYFAKLAGLEYKAYTIMQANKDVGDYFDIMAKYHLNNQEIKEQLYSEGLDGGTFKGRLENIIKPVYEAAKMQGFRKWEYTETA